MTGDIEFDFEEVCYYKDNKCWGEIKDWCKEGVVAGYSTGPVTCHGHCAVFSGGAYRWEEHEKKYTTKAGPKLRATFKPVSITMPEVDGPLKDIWDFNTIMNDDDELEKLGVSSSSEHGELGHIVRDGGIVVPTTVGLGNVSKMNAVPEGK